MFTRSGYTPPNLLPSMPVGTLFQPPPPQQQTSPPPPPPPPPARGAMVVRTNHHHHHPSSSSPLTTSSSSPSTSSHNRNNNNNNNNSVVPVSQMALKPPDIERIVSHGLEPHPKELTAADFTTTTTTTTTAGSPSPVTLIHPSASEVNPLARATKRIFSIVMVYAEWCGICKSMTPLWDDFYKSSTRHRMFNVYAIDGHKHGALSKAIQLTGFPTIILFVNGKLLPIRPPTRDPDRIAEVVMAYMFGALHLPSSITA